MKKIIAMLLCLLMAMSLVACGNKEEEAVVEDEPGKIAIITGTTSQGEDEYAAAQAIKAKYGDRVLLDTYPDNFSEEYETVVTTIAKYADDPTVKAVIVNQAVPGTAEAFKKIKETNPDVLCMAGTAQEEYAVIAPAADIVINNNPYARGYLMIKTAKDLGCDTFVHVSFPRHMSMQDMQIRHAILEKTCEEMGLKFYDETSPDPTDTSAGGMPGAVAFMQETTPQWIEKYGQNAAFFCTNDGETEPMLAALVANGGYFIEADLPSPLMGYPGALGIEGLGFENVNWDDIVATVENAINEAGGAGRFGTWKVSLGYSTGYGLAEYAFKYMDGEFDTVEMDDVRDVFDEVTGVGFNFAKFTDAANGVTYQNCFLIYEDTYIMGNPGYPAGNTEVEIPDWVYSITGAE